MVFSDFASGKLDSDGDRRAFSAQLYGSQQRACREREYQTGDGSGGAFLFIRCGGAKFADEDLHDRR
jgi:hypothetical protein